MRTALIASFMIAVSGTAVSAQSCYDLWYARNAIYNAKGFCFKSQLGKQTFNNGDCYTSNPRLSPAEQGRVDAIRAEERRRGCKVN